MERADTPNPFLPSLFYLGKSGKLRFILDKQIFISKMKGISIELKNSGAIKNCNIKHNFMNVWHGICMKMKI